MDAFFQAQGWLTLALGLVAFAVEIFALVDAVRQREDAYPAASKRTKRFWVIVLAVAAALGYISIGNLPGLIGIVGFVAAAVYLADVRPALQQVTGRGRRDGPYGPW